MCPLPLPALATTLTHPNPPRCRTTAAGAFNSFVQSSNLLKLKPHSHLELVDGADLLQHMSSLWVPSEGIMQVLLLQPVLGDDAHACTLPRLLLLQQA